MFMAIYSATAYSRNTRICTKIVRLFCRGTLIVMRIVIRVYELERTMDKRVYILYKYCAIDPVINRLLIRVL